VQELNAFRNQGSGLQTGKYARYYCPIHGSDNQRSFSLNPVTGHFKCFTCGAWGYLTDGQFNTRGGVNKPRKKSGGPIPLPDEYLEFLFQLQQNLPGSLGEKYLDKRGIPLDLAQEYGVGYAPYGEWPHINQRGAPVRQWKKGRLVFPHTDPAGLIVNLYGRTVDIGFTATKGEKHDHLPGPKGGFNSPVLPLGTVYICEGVFDALSLIAAGYKDACAIFGVDGLRWEWVRAQRVVFCMDPDQGGSRWKESAREGILRGKEIHFLPESFYEGHEDLNALWIATGRLDLGNIEGGDKHV